MAIRKRTQYSNIGTIMAAESERHYFRIICQSHSVSGWHPSADWFLPYIGNLNGWVQMGGVTTKNMLL